MGVTYTGPSLVYETRAKRNGIEICVKLSSLLSFLDVEEHLF